MRLITPLLASTLVAALLAGCSSDSTGSTDGGSTNDCSIGISGAATATLSCSLAPDVVTSDGSSSWNATSPDGTNNASLTITFDNAPTTTTYTQSNSSAFLSVEIGSKQYVSGASLGAYTLTLTSVTAGLSGGGVNTYNVHGTLTSTLGSLSDSGTVAINVKF